MLQPSITKICLKITYLKFPRGQRVNGFFFLPSLQRVRKLVHHTEEWGPCLDENRKLYLESLRKDGEITSEEQLEKLTKKHPDDNMDHTVV